MSIDVEGSEYAVIKNFDFSKYRFNFIAIEHLYFSDETHTAVSALFEDAGYRRILKEFSGDDSFYVPADSAQDLPAGF